ncbi:xanthine dehydrogenase family protein molybdopterin-binding subunit [Roseospira goensis]|uniref:Isoquinoline 1-oxidoreductase beta subunit n=1 Tax=Roseospira goensis TaxID=391922 RepID=A0A7W6RXJ6_9PROT|nr:xanthine dehydrogenase family protein molybdopterin-binding subunit [Roseospira goensis]MBB4285064.1 isoquinoline 1-oxidoreductase beta subunit [Roseospira goensis]
MVHRLDRPTPGTATAGLRPSRRDLLRVTAGVGAGLTLALMLPGGAAPAQDVAAAKDAGDAPFAPNAFIRVTPDNTVTVVIKHLEMGQGVFTGLATLVAEEMDAAWDQIRPEHAPADATRYNNLFWGPVQGTGGSTSLANAFEQMRRAGAVARAMLVHTASEAWGVEAAAVTVEAGVLRHAGSGREASFGAMADAAGRLTPPDPQTVDLKAPDRFRLIGQTALPRPDTAEKTDGRAVYAIDVRLKGMLTALVRRPPRFGATLRTLDAEAARAMPGVRAVVRLPNGVAVVAESFWQAQKAREALKIAWDDSAAVTTGSEAMLEDYESLAQTPGTVFRNDGDALAALTEPQARVVEARYTVPFLAHAPMEPLSAVARLTDSGIEVWAGSQTQTFDVLNIAEAAGLRPDQVTLHTVFAGGSFGRRASVGSDYLREVAGIARGLTNQGIEAPVKLIWTREDDIRGGFYRPMALHAVTGALDATGRPVAWRHRVVCQSIMAGTPFESVFVKDGIDGTSVEGVSDLAYAVPNVMGDLHSPTSPVPVLWWRSVGHSHTAFAVESFVDELAHAAGADPLILRMDLLRDQPRLLRVLALAAEKAGWGLPMEPGRGHGVAVHKSFNSYVAHVAEVTATDGGFTVDRLVCAVDCGVPVNPDIIRAQIAGGSAFGLSAALRSRLTLDDKGVVEQSNFHDYEVLRLAAMPEVEVHIVPSTEPPTGVGEPGVPTVAPAVANAVFAATGTRLRRLPLTLG